MVRLSYEHIQRFLHELAWAWRSHPVSDKFADHPGHIWTGLTKNKNKQIKPQSPWTTSKLSNSRDIISHLQSNMMFDLTDDVFLSTTKLIIIPRVTHEFTK
jgi:hypothetical protein